MCPPLQEMRDLQEQVRDLMFYLETQKKISESPESTRQVSETPPGDVLPEVLWSVVANA